MAHIKRTRKGYSVKAGRKGGNGKTIAWVKTKAAANKRLRKARR